MFRKILAVSSKCQWANKKNLLKNIKWRELPKEFLQTVQTNVVNGMPRGSWSSAWRPRLAPSFQEGWGECTFSWWMLSRFYVVIEECY